MNRTMAHPPPGPHQPPGSPPGPHDLPSPTPTPRPRPSGGLYESLMFPGMLAWYPEGCVVRATHGRMSAVVA